MGCDIHLYRERFADGRWQSIDKWTASDGESESHGDVDYDDRAYTGRNYDFFGLIAKGVRRTFKFSLEARGMPLQCSEEVAAAAAGWDGDGHSHSYLYLHELRELQQWAATRTMPVSGMMDKDQWARLRASIDSGAPDWDLLYPYCQGTNDPGAVAFAVAVPIAFKVGDALTQIINSFDDADGATHRIVFWFDN